MAKKIFIASTEARSGKSLVTIGLFRALQGIIPHVGYMKPIAQRLDGDRSHDCDAALIRSIFDLQDDIATINPTSMADAQGDQDDFFEKVFAAYDTVSTGKDVVLIEGTDYTSAVAALEFDINAELAKNLVAPVLLVANGANKSIDEIVSAVGEVGESVQSLGCNLLGAVINRFKQPDPENALTELRKRLNESKISLFGVLPPRPRLSGPRLSEVAERLDASIVYQGDDMSKVVTEPLILAMTPENALSYMKDKEGLLLITPGDRVDVIFAALNAQESSMYPKYSGLILTGGLVPGKNVRNMFKGMRDTDMTILSVKEDTYTVGLRVNETSGELTADDTEKTTMVFNLIERNLDIDRLYRELGEIKTEAVTPRMFQYRLIQKAKEKRTHLVLPEGTEPRIVRASAEILERDVCRLTLLGDVHTIKKIAHDTGSDLTGANLVDPAHTDKKVRLDYADTLYELRKHKSVTQEMARDLMLDPVYFATMMVYEGDADGFVSGATHSTADTLGPVLRVIKTAPGTSLASSIFFMLMPNDVLVYGDCALVENPTAEQLADIAVTSADTAQAFGVTPYVAMLSYSTGQSGSGKDVDKVRRATQIAREKRPDLPIEGPIQYDAAASPDVARVKIKNSAVAGKATVYIFPDLDAGNTAYKAVQRSANVPAIGPVMQGLKKPANDLSRGALVIDIVYTIAITAIQAQLSGTEQS